ncbi:hypothetical protein [Luteimonas sp. A478]
MDTFQLVASLAESLAWPITALVLFVLLRKPLIQILLTTTKLKYKDIELDFGRELRQIEQQAMKIELLPIPQPPARATGGPKLPGELLEEAEMLANEFPEPAVTVAWSAVEDNLARAAERLTGSRNFRTSAPSQALKLLKEREAIDGSTASVLRRMQKLRNEAVHERWNAFGGVSSVEAREYIALARGINDKLEHIGLGP